MITIQVTVKEIESGLLSISIDPDKSLGTEKEITAGTAMLMAILGVKKLIKAGSSQSVEKIGGADIKKMEEEALATFRAMQKKP